MRRACLLIALALTLASCNYRKVQLTIELTNKSRGPIKNIEVDYPGGTYGVTALDVYATNQHTVEMQQSGCTLHVKFEDTLGHAQPASEIKVGDSCPPRVSLVIDAQMAVSVEQK